MASLADEMRYWSSKADDAHRNILDVVQASAGKWQAAIAAFLGVYATIGFVLAPDKISTLPVHGWLQVVVIAMLIVAGLLGVAAIVYANCAAQGIPEILAGDPITGPRMYQLVRDRAVSARHQLGFAIGLAAAAGVLIVVTSSGLLVAGALQARKAHATVVSSSGAYCGELINSDGVLMLRLSSGKIVPVAGGAMTSVNSCP